MKPATGAAPADTNQKPLKERMKAFMEAQQLTVKAFSERCDCSVAVIYKIQNGEAVKEKFVNKIEDVLAGRSGNGADPTFDATCEALIAVVVGAAEQNELDELVRLTFNRWNSVRSPDDAKAFANSVLRRYLAAETPEVRVTALLELRDVFKKNRTPAR